MNVPDFKKYGVLKALYFKYKKDRFNYIKPTILGEVENENIKTKIRTELFSMFNSRLTEIVTQTKETKLNVIEHYVGTIKVHPLTEFELDAKYTSLDSIIELVNDETSNILLSTIKTSKLIKELLRRATYRK